MKVRVNHFINFAYGDKRRDKATVKGILEIEGAPYDPAKDRYKQFREAMTAFEEKKLSEAAFLSLHNNVSANKSAGYKVLCRNYVDLKEDHALVWQGRSPVEAQIAGLEISTAWYLRTEANNQQRIIFLHFGKDPMPHKKQKGLLTLLNIAEPASSGVGVLNIQQGTLITASRIDQTEADYLEVRAKKFLDIANKLKSDG